MRDRLIELIREYHAHPEKTCPRIDTFEPCSGCKYDKGSECDHDGKLADRLLAAGCILPPCKVGDRAYYLTSVDTEKELGVTDIFCGTVQSLAFDGKNIWIAVKYTNGLYYHHKAQDIGRDVFLSPEEAERALAERREG